MLEAAPQTVAEIVEVIWVDKVVRVKTRLSQPFRFLKTVLIKPVFFNAQEVLFKNVVSIFKIETVMVTMLSHPVLFLRVSK